MKKLLLIKNGVVQNICVGTADQGWIDAMCTQYDSVMAVDDTFWCQPGDKYDGVSTFSRDPSVAAGCPGPNIPVAPVVAQKGKPIAGVGPPVVNIADPINPLP